MLIGFRHLALDGSRFALALLVLTLTLTLTGVAHADPKPAAIELRYRAPAGCPEMAEFVAEVRRSTARLEVAQPGAGARHFEVVIGDTGRAGLLSVEGGREGERLVQGADCAEVSRVLAFAVALAADPDAHETAGTSNVAAFPATANTATATAPAGPAVGAMPLPPATEYTLAPRSPLNWSIGSFYSLKGGSTPKWALAGGLFGELGSSALPLAPRLRLGAGYGRRVLTLETGYVTFSSYLVTLDVCSALGRGRLTFLPCLRALGGLRTTSGHDVPGGRAETRPFLELGPAVHARWRVLHSVFVELGGALLFPTIQDTILIEPAPVVYRVPAVGGLAEVSVGLEFGDQTAH